jgi:hypothetical protein
MLFSSGLVKIGLSGDPYKRYKRLTSNTPFKEELIFIDFIKLNGRSEARVLENALHMKYKSYSYIFTYKFEGYTEFFSKDIPLIELIKDLRTYTRGVDDIVYFNPFISMENTTNALLMEVRKWFTKHKKIKLFRESGSSGSVYLKCLLGNIISSNNNHYSLPQTIKTIHICIKMQRVIRNLKDEDVSLIRGIVLKHVDKPLVKTYNRMYTDFDILFNTLYYKDRCGLPYLNSLIDNNKDSFIGAAMIKAYHNIHSFTDNCKIRKEK